MAAEHRRPPTRQTALLTQPFAYLQCLQQETSLMVLAAPEHFPIVGDEPEIVYGQAQFKLLTGHTNKLLAREVGRILQVTPDENPPRFADKEVRVILPPVSEQDVYVLQSASPSPNTSMMELFLMLHTAKKNGARSLNAIVPYLAYSRQDRAELEGAAESALAMTVLLKTGGADRLLAVDIHSEDPLRRGELPWVNLDSSLVLLPVIQQMIKEEHLNVKVGFPDHGAAKRYANYVHSLTPTDSPAVIKKVRDVHANNQTMVQSMEGEVAGRDIILVDDIIDTAGSICKAADFMKLQGAKSVRVVATHGIFSGKALENIRNSGIDQVIVTDTVATTPEVAAEQKIHIVSIAPVVAEAIRRIENKHPMWDLMKKKLPEDQKPCSEDFESSYQ